MSALLLSIIAPKEIVLKSLVNLGITQKKQLKVDFIKISHHGSSHNTTDQLISSFDCDKDFRVGKSRKKTLK